MGASYSRQTTDLSEHVRDRVFGTKACQSQDDLELVSQACAVRSAQELLSRGGKQRFEDLYGDIQTVSYGASSTVVKATDRASGNVVACKIIPKLKSSCHRIVQRKLRMKVIYEIATMLTVSEHRNVAKLHAAHEDDKNFYLVMDYYSGGELFDHIVRRREGYTENQAAAIMKDILDFLMYSHSLGVVHADIKPENIVYSNEGENGVLKIIDFGLSVFCGSDETHKNVFGTIGYCSPEMANDVTGQKTDIWSAGILLYFLLSGKPPFRHANNEITLCRLRKRPLVAFSEEIWDNVSNEAKSFIRCLLDPSPNQRVSASEALKLTWLHDSLLQVRSGNKLGALACDSLQLFGNLSRLKRLFWECIARNASHSLVGDQLEQFCWMDRDGNGVVDFEEFESALATARPDMTRDQLSSVFTALDVDGSGDIDRIEFVAASIALLAREHQKEFTLSTFRRLDTEQNGFVSRKELRDAILAQIDAKTAGNVITDLEFEIANMDANGDGVISFEEFNCAMTDNMSVETLPPSLSLDLDQPS